MIAKIKILRRIDNSGYENYKPELRESDESFEKRINEFLSNYKHNAPVFLSEDLCHIYYEED